MKYQFHFGSLTSLTIFRFEIISKSQRVRGRLSCQEVGLFKKKRVGERIKTLYNHCFTSEA